MITLLIFFIAFQFIAPAGGLYFSIKIARIPVTPTKTWILFLLGWLMWIAQNLTYYIFVNPIGSIVADTEPVEYLSITTGALLVLFFFAGTVRVYYDLKSKFRGLI